MKKAAVLCSGPNADGPTARQSVRSRAVSGTGDARTPRSARRGLTRMGMRAYDRIPVVRYNRDYMLPALCEAGRTYADRLENGFNMYY